MGERCTVEGTVQSVIFQNEENGYTVLSLAVDGQEEPVTVVGCIPCAAAGEGMTVTGVWVEHPSYGPQLTAESVERRLPRDEADMAAYLGSGILKGVGPATAERLVERFGMDTLRVIEEEPERLQTLKGITAKRAMELSAAFRALTGLRQVMEFLARYELPVHLAMAVQRTYGDGAMQALRDDPYLLSREQYGVDFAVTDAIALSMGFGGDDPCRLEAAVLYELSHNLHNGHVFLPREKLIQAAAQLIGVETDAVVWRGGEAYRQRDGLLSAPALSGGDICGGAAGVYGENAGGAAGSRGKDHRGHRAGAGRVLRALAAAGSGAGGGQRRAAAHRRAGYRQDHVPAGHRDPI